MTTTWLGPDDVEFLLHIVGHDPDADLGRLAVRTVAALPLGEAAARRALEVVRESPSRISGTAEAEAALEAAALAARSTPADLPAEPHDPDVADRAHEGLFAERLPPDLRPALAALPGPVVADLLAELVEVVLGAATAGRARGGLDRATRNLGTFAHWSTADGSRSVVAGWAPDPRVTDVAAERWPWVDGVLGLVGAPAWTNLARRLAVRSELRARALRLLQRAGPRLHRGAALLQAPGRTGPWPAARTDLELFDLLALARPQPRRPLGDGPVRTPERVVVHPRLAAPERVDLGEVFVAEVGLAPFADAALGAAAMEVPDHGFRLEMEIVAEGCDVLDGGSLVAVDVSAEAPWPCEPVRLRAPDRPRACQLTVLYAADGRRIGTATRTVHVGPAAPTAGARTAARLRSSWPPVLGTADDPDVDLVVLRDDERGRLVWLGRSRHEESRVEEFSALPPDVGRTMDTWMGGLDDRRAHARRRRTVLRNVGRRIGALVPPEVWELVRRAHAKTGRPPGVLLSTQYGELPWELARTDAPWLADAPPLLGAQADLGCWPLPLRPATTTVVPHPPDRLDLATMAVLASPELRQAQIEARHLEETYGAKRLELAGPAIEDHLCGEATAEVVHLAAHGNVESGIDLGEDEVGFGELDVPDDGCSLLRLVFLNACELGRGRAELGEFTGMAPALVRAGAQAVVAALWQVNDRAARSLAEDFYHAVFVKGNSPAAFLREQRATEHPGAGFDRNGYIYVGHPRLRIAWTGPFTLHR